MRKIAAVFALFAASALADNVPPPPLPPIVTFTTSTSPPSQRLQEAAEVRGVTVAEALLAGTDPTVALAAYRSARDSWTDSQLVTALTLVAGTDKNAVPRAPSAVATHVFPNVVTKTSRQSTMFNGMPLNFYSNVPVAGGGTTPVVDTTEFSLDGGPWLAACNDGVSFPAGLAAGIYNLRVEIFPALGGNSVPLHVAIVTVGANGSISVQ